MFGFGAILGTLVFENSKVSSGKNLFFQNVLDGKLECDCFGQEARQESDPWSQGELRRGKCELQEDYGVG